MDSLFLFVCQFSVILCCGSGGGGEPEKAVSNEFPILDREDDLNRNLPGAWGGFTPSPEVVAKWRNWLQEHLKQKQMNEDMPASAFKDRDSASGWPYHWKGIGAGQGRVEPPPWAYEPINIGLPAFCYHPPIKGKCNEKLVRWAFNAYIDECVEYEYSGCGESQNSFKEKLRCEQSCMITPLSGCDPDTKTYI